MAENALQQLVSCGQSPWIDYIRRSFVANGELQRLVDSGICGVTSNPTIFEKAIAGSGDYDDDLRELAKQGASAEQIFQRLASHDVQAAADVLRPVYDSSEGRDGFVSIEVSPESAHDTQKTIDDAHLFCESINRPNIMIKVPATDEGLPAVEQLISEGINVNITLIFAVEMYERVMDAYLRGLEKRAQSGEPLDRVASVASFFVSRVDTLVDKLLEDKAKEDPVQAAALKGLDGKAAIANAKIAYQKFQEVFGSERFKRLEEKGARVQRPLWASTSTKNPAYPDTYYVTTLVGPDTVNTMPQQTIAAVIDHGRIECGTVMQDVEQAHQVVGRLKQVGIDMRSVTDELTVDGVQKFTDSLHQLYQVIREKVSAVQEESATATASLVLDGQRNAVDATLRDMAEQKFVQRIWEKDPSLWKPNPADQNEITDRLGWLHVSDCMLEHKDCFREIAQTVREAGYTHAVVLGMGGSSLAPFVLAQTFGRQDGFPELLVLDSTDPEALLAVERAIDLDRTLFLVSTKSGTTTETLSFFETFWEKVQERKGDKAGEQFVAITDPGTPLEDTARERHFRFTYLNPPDIGGRYSALSYFGLIPAAVMGLNVEKLLDRGMRMEQACAPSVPPEQNPGAWLGAVMGELAKNGRDKVTFFLSPPIDTLGLWLEQLLAESTGKEGKGLIPVPDNPPGPPSAYGDDHLFVYIALKGADDGELQTRVEALKQAGQPMVRLDMNDKYDLAGEFFRWEFATAVAGALLGINAFDQPNVQESKDNTKRVLQEYESSGRLPQPQALAAADGLELYVNDAARPLLDPREDSVEGALRSFLSHVQPPQYLAIMAYIAPDAEHDRVLYPLRARLRDALKVATTFGYGPRFLHSTGQLHKGGTPEGVFLQITARAEQDVPVPGEKYSYQTLIEAQALGDLQSLQQHGRPAISIKLPDESEASLQKLAAMLESGVSQPVRS